MLSYVNRLELRHYTCDVLNKPVFEKANLHCTHLMPVTIITIIDVTVGFFKYLFFVVIIIVIMIIISIISVVNA